MSAKVYEIAGALHKGTQQVLMDLQEMNEPVKKIYDEVADQAILALAEVYGRTDYVLDLLSNDFIHELAKTWSEEDLLKLFPETDWSKSFLATKNAERILNLKEYLPNYVEKCENQPATSKTPKVFRALHLIGNDEKAILVPKNERDLQVFLIPQNKKDAEPCCICFDRKKILYTEINIQSCMLLVWADGAYFYEPAPFTKFQGKYYLELHKFFHERNVEAARFSEIHWSKKGIWDMAKYVLPGKSGFAVQDKLKCTLKIDQERLLICSGSVETIFWEAANAKMTIKGQMVVRNAVSEILEQSGEMNCEQFQEAENSLQKVFKECAEKDWIYYNKDKKMEIPELFKDNFLERKENEVFDLAVEAYVRLRLLEQQGFSKNAVKQFSESRKVFMSRGKDGVMPLQDRFLARRVRSFEKENHAVAYFCILSKTEEGSIATIFYVSEKREKWAKERKELMQGQAKVHMENLSRKDRSKTGRMQFRIVNGGIEALA